MDQKSLRELEARCTQEEPPPCQAGCPLGVDVRAFHQEMGKKKYTQARKILEKHLPLSPIVALLCEGPCRAYCHRKELGGSINTPQLEKFCIENSQSKTRILPLPPKPHKVAIIGSGPDALTASFDLIKKGYPTSVYHLEEGPGSWLIDHPLLSQEILNKEIAGLKKLGVQFIAVKKLSKDNIAVDQYQALMLSDDAEIFATNNAPDLETGLIESCYFGSPFINPKSPFIDAVSGGRLAALSIDRFLQGASLTASRVPLRHGKTDLYVNLSEIPSSPAIHSLTVGTYTEEEAAQEANRCIRCECLECVKKCVFLQEYKAFPKTYARRIYNNSAIVKGNHQANKMINSCSLCRQCEVVCPNDFSMADLCLEARSLMVKEDRMPPSAQHFALEEMHAATGDSLLSHAEGQTSSQALFFPGCQLAGIRPQQSAHLYTLLTKQQAQTGLWLDCCGAPLYWGGRQEEFASFSAEFIRKWRSMGEPEIISACASCQYIFENHLVDESGQKVTPKLRSAWQAIADMDIKATGNGRLLAVSDPCTARHKVDTQEAVRALIIKAGYRLSPLAASKELTECCGFGGLMESCNQDLAAKVVTARAAQTDETILTYCAMCRDQIAKTGKEVSHILDLLFPAEAIVATDPPVSLSTRRHNRRRLKNRFQEMLDAETTQPSDWEMIPLVVSDEVAKTLEQRRVLKDDIQKTLHYCIENKRFFQHGNGKTKICYHRIGTVTYWVQFREDEGFHIEGAWSHRMNITGGA